MKVKWSLIEQTRNKYSYVMIIYLWNLTAYWKPCWMVKTLKEHVMNSCCFDLHVVHLHNHSNSRFFIQEAIDLIEKISRLLWCWGLPLKTAGIFLGLIWAFPIQKWAKTSENGVYHSQLLSSTFWWKFHENPNKKSKVTDAWKCEWKHVFIHIFMQIFMSF